MSARYDHPYPSPALAAEHPFVVHEFSRLSEAEMEHRAAEFSGFMEQRRSVRMFSDEPMSRSLIEQAVVAGSTAPSGAHKQPWRFVATADSAIKQQIRQAAEEEERVNYLDSRMNEEWQEALAPLGTDHHKEFLEIAPWIVVLFEERYEQSENGERRKNYYVKESTGIAAGMFVTAIHTMGLATLPHPPMPMAFPNTVLGRPQNERPFIMFPVGFPMEGVRVPDLRRKPLDQVLTIVGERAGPT